MDIFMKVSIGCDKCDKCFKNDTDFAKHKGVNESNNKVF